VFIKVKAFKDMVLCRLVNTHSNRSFERASCIHFQDQCSIQWYGVIPKR